MANLYDIPHNSPDPETLLMQLAAAQAITECLKKGCTGKAREYEDGRVEQYGTHNHDPPDFNHEVRRMRKQMSNVSRPRVTLDEATLNDMKKAEAQLTQFIAEEALKSASTAQASDPKNCPAFLPMIDSPQKTPLSRLSGEQTSRRKRAYSPSLKTKLAELVREYPHLYQSRPPGHKQKNTLSEAWTEVAQIISAEFNLDAESQDIACELSYLWRNLRDQLKHHRRVARHKWHFEGVHPQSVLRRWEFFDVMSFFNEELNVAERSLMTPEELEKDPLCNEEVAGPYEGSRESSLQPKVPRLSTTPQLDSINNQITLDELLRRTDQAVDDDDSLFHQHDDFGSCNELPRHLTDTCAIPGTSSIENQHERTSPEAGNLSVPTSNSSTPTDKEIVSSGSTEALSPDPCSMMSMNQQMLPAQQNQAEAAIVAMVREKHSLFQAHSHSLATEFEGDLLRVVMSYVDRYKTSLPSS